MDKKTKTLIINITWKPLFAATITGILSKATSIDAIVIGVLIGIAASLACYFEIKKYLSQKGS